MSTSDLRGPSGEPGADGRRDPGAATPSEQEPRQHGSREQMPSERVAGERAVRGRASRGRTGRDPSATDQAAAPPPPEPPEPIHLNGPRPGRRRVAAAGGVIAVAAVGISAFALRGGSESPAADDAPTSTATAAVARRDLEERTDLEGTLGYGETSEVSLAAQGTVTWLPPEGTIVERGQAVAEIDDRVIPLLYGDRPLWRELGPDVDDGVDVELIEANLVALGVVTADELTVDQDWTSATTDAVEEWQEALGLEETGRIGLGDVVVQPDAVRVTGHPTAVGGQAGGPLAEVAGITRQVTVDLEATRQGLITVGQAVEIELPDGTTVPGKVLSVGTVAEAPVDDAGDPMADQTPTIEVTISLDDPAAAGNLDEAPVTVSVVTSAAQGVIAVPVDALLALAEGGYAVEVVGAGGASEMIAVEIGAFADGWVEVTGDLAEGDDVVVPA
jgi:hypothetical protein